MLDATVATMPFINSQDGDILELIKGYEAVFVVEEHFAYGGLGAFLKERFDEYINLNSQKSPNTQANLNLNQQKIHQIALPNKFIHKVGNQGFLREYFGLNAEGIVKRVEKTIKESL